MRSIIGVINEKYALDSSIFTRRDRRGNAQAGYFNGGPAPFGHRAQTVAVEGRKERRRLVIVEEEAAVVRLIYDLARSGLHGTPMGTRAIAQHLNTLGYRNRGREFFHSSVDGILTRQHYSGRYLDRMADSIGRKPSIDESTIAKFGKLICEQLKRGNPALRKAYVRLLIHSVSVDNHAIHIQGSKAALESALVRSGDAAMSMVPIFDREWCRLQDSNL